MYTIAATQTDPTEAAGLVEEHCNGKGIRFRADAESFEFDYQASGDDRLTVRRVRSSAQMTGMIGPVGHYRLAWTLDGRFMVDQGAGAVVVERSVPAMLPTASAFQFDAEPSSARVLQFDADFLEAVAVARTHRPGTPLHLPITAPTPLVGPLREALETHTPSLMDPSLDPEDRASRNVTVAEAVLAAFVPGSGHRHPPTRKASAAERADDFIRHAFAERITVDDIATAAGVSVRTLQTAFLQAGLPSPKQRLQEVRLRKARAALQIARPGEVTIHGIAHAHGFRHMSRFAATYLRAMGEHPSDTLASKS